MAITVVFYQANMNYARTDPASAPKQSSDVDHAVAASARKVCALSIVAMAVISIAVYVTARLLGTQDINDARLRSAAEDDRLEQAVFEAQAREAAANQSKAMLADSMAQAAHAHLNEITSMAESLASTDLSDNQHLALQAIRDSADSLVGLFGDSIDLSGMRVRDQETADVQFSLRSCIADAVDAIRARAEAKLLDLRYAVDLNAVDSLVGDPGRLRQVLMNLLCNAVECTNHGRIALSVDVRSHNLTDVVLEFAVSDTGMGIAGGLLADVEKMLKDPGSTIPGRLGQQGIHLLVTARLVKLMRGQISVQSNGGYGTTFRCVMPFCVQDRSSRVLATKPVDLRRMPALVVGLNAAERARIGQVLADLDMQPVLVTTGQEALILMKNAREASEPWPLLVLSAYLPDMTGFDLAERAVQTAAPVGMTVVMLASVGRRGDAARCRELGISAYLTQPVRPTLLETAIRMALGAAEEGQRRPLLTRHTLHEAQRRLQVLLAVDKHVDRRAVEYMAELWGHSVVTASNEMEALVFADRQPFDLVLVDGDMQNMAAPRTIARIRGSDHCGKRTTILAMVSRSGSDQELQCVGAGADGTLLKPITAQALHNALGPLVAAKCDGTATSRSTDDGAGVAVPHGPKHAGTTSAMAVEMVGSPSQSDDRDGAMRQ